MFARHATGFASGAGSPKRREPRFGGVRGAITKLPSLSRRYRRICTGHGRRGRFRRVEDAPARFTGVNFLAFWAANFLVGMRKQAHPAAAALFADGLGECHAVVTFRGARVHVKDFFRTGVTGSTTVGVSGGTERSFGRLSLGADNINGVFPNNLSSGGPRLSAVHSAQTRS